MNIGYSHEASRNNARAYGSWMKRTAIVIAGLAAAGSVLLTGCTDQRDGTPTSPSQSTVLPTNGPLLYRMQDHSTVCTSAKKHTRFVLATHVKISPDRRVRINEITPFDAHGVEVESLDIVPIPSEYFEMLIEPIPPRGEFRDAWEERTSAKGAIVSSTEHVQLTAIVRVPSGEPGSLGGFEITYTDLGTDTDFLTRTTLSLRTEPGTCSED